MYTIKLTAEQITELVNASKSAVTPLTKKRAVDLSKIEVGQTVYAVNPGGHCKVQVVRITPESVEVQNDIIQLRFDRAGKWLGEKVIGLYGEEEAGPWQLWTGPEWGWYWRDEYR